MITVADVIRFITHSVKCVGNKKPIGRFTDIKISKVSKKRGQKIAPF